jgi:hypothetical protein
MREEVPAFVSLGQTLFLAESMLTLQFIHNQKKNIRFPSFICDGR